MWKYSPPPPVVERAINLIPSHRRRHFHLAESPGVNYWPSFIQRCNVSIIQLISAALFLFFWGGEGLINFQFFKMIFLSIFGGDVAVCPVSGRPGSI